MDRFCLILARPQHARNIGACARVAANFDLSTLRVVAPVCTDWRTDEEASKLAVASSNALLKNAPEFGTLEAALADCHAAIGFTRRHGKVRRQTVPFHELEELAADSPLRITLVFGNEEWGLSDAATALCTRLAEIPTSEHLGSMNLSHAVAVVASRLFSEQQTRTESTQPLSNSAEKNQRAPRGWKSRLETPATLEENEALFSHWTELLTQVGLTEAGNPERMIRSLRRILLKEKGLSQADVRLLRGFLSKTQRALSAAPDPAG